MSNPTRVHIVKEVNEGGVRFHYKNYPFSYNQTQLSEMDSIDLSFSDTMEPGEKDIILSALKGRVNRVVKIRRYAR